MRLLWARVVSAAMSPCPIYIHVYIQCYIYIRLYIQYPVCNRTLVAATSCPKKKP